MPDPMTAERAAEPAADATMRLLLAAMEARLRSFLGNLCRAEVDDLAQETMARAWRSRHALDADRGSGEAWLLRIAFRAFLDSRKRRPINAEHDEEPEATGSGPAQQAAVRDHAEALLAQLTATEREALLRFHRDGQSIDDIATALGMPAGTVKSHLHRARSRLWSIERARGEQP